MINLSLCMIVRDEALRLPAFLAAHRDWPCTKLQWVVIDTGSVDETPAILQAAGIAPHHFPWVNDFSAARNHALEQASGEWVISLDADEFVVPATQQQLTALMSDPAIAGIEAVQRNYCGDCDALMWQVCDADDAAWSGGAAGYIPARIVRFFRRAPTVRWRSPIHELIKPAIVQAGGAIAASDCVIHHYGWMGDGVRQDRKRGMYRAIAEAIASGRAEADAKSLFEIARSCDSKLEQIEYLQRALELSPGDAVILAHLGQSCLATGALVQALAWATQLISVHPSEVWGYALAAQCYYKMKQPEQGLAILAPAMPASENNPHLLYACGMLHLTAMRPALAQHYLQRAATRNPSSLRIRADLQEVDMLMHKFSITPFTVPT